MNVDLLWLVGEWMLFWNVCHGLCYLVLPLWLLPEERKQNRLRLSLRAVSIVHAFISYFELYESISLGLLTWPPKGACISRFWIIKLSILIVVAL
jgi:hypothetical protein